jgi:uncharacterized membrane protein
MKTLIITALTYRLFGTAITSAIAFGITHRWQLAGLIGGLDFVVKMTAYFIHEELLRQQTPHRPRGGQPCDNNEGGRPLELRR